MLLKIHVLSTRIVIVLLFKDLHSVLNKNPSYVTTLRIRDDFTSAKNDYADIKFYSYKPLTSIDVKWSFSEYKAVVPSLP